MRTWVSHILYMVLPVLGYLGKKVFKKIDGICCSHKFKDMILVLRSDSTDNRWKKRKYLFQLAKVYKQIICKSSW